MTNLEMWRTITIVTAAIGQTMFVLLYMTFPWWKAFLGRALFFKACAFGILLDVAVVGRLVDWSNEDGTFVVLYGVLAVGIWAQFFAFLRTKRKGRR